MTQHVDILEEQDSLRKPLYGSVALHLAVFGVLLTGSLTGGRQADLLGGPNPGGGAIGINVVKQIPLPARAGVTNPLANNSQTTVPLPPPKPKAQPRQEAPEPNAIPLKSRKATKRREDASSKTTYRAPGQNQPNQLTSTTGPALVSPMIGQTGSGGVGIGTNSSFGTRWGWYGDLIRQKVDEKWHPVDVDPRLQNAPPVIVDFTIMRDGSVRNVRVVQRSGNSVLDYSAQRAIYDASPFPGLPGDYPRNEANVEFWFQLRK